jgi:hypothetical protein
MNRTTTFLSAVALLAGVTTIVPASEAGAAPAVAANWQLNDPAGSRVMADSSGHGLNGTISSSAASQGLTLNGSYYHWSTRCPACLPVQDGRVVQVPDDDRLEIPDASVTFTLEFRYRTTHAYGNIMQKGQSTTKGGQIKVQLPGGRVQCLFKGADGTRVGSGSGSRVYDDGQWHTVKCVHTSSRVETWVDGVRVGVKNGATGPIDNTKPFTVGGKLNCDQIDTTCDYYSGDVDYIKVSHG